MIGSAVQERRRSRSGGAEGGPGEDAVPRFRSGLRRCSRFPPRLHVGIQPGQFPKAGVRQVVAEAVGGEERGEPGGEFAGTPARHVAVAHDHDRAVARVLGTRDQRPGQQFVVGPGELEPATALRRRLRHLLQRRGRRRRQHVDHARFGRGARRSLFGLRVRQAGNTRRGKHDGHAHRCPHDNAGRVGVSFLAQHLVDETPPVERFPVRGQGHLAAGAPREVVEIPARKSRPGCSFPPVHGERKRAATLREHLRLIIAGIPHGLLLPAFRQHPHVLPERSAPNCGGQTSAGTGRETRHLPNERKSPSRGGGEISVPHTFVGGYGELLGQVNPVGHGRGPTRCRTGQIFANVGTRG